jgi:hypothetical protein
VRKRGRRKEFEKMEWIYSREREEGVGSSD